MTTQKNLKEQIIDLLKSENKQDVETFASYVISLLLAKNKDGSLKNPWAPTRTTEYFVKGFLKVKQEGLVFDGKHITFQSTGISYDFVAYKNKMLIAYPESKIDIGVVKEGDTFNLEKVDGDITYRHIIAEPFKTADVGNIIGAYCIIKNKRGNFDTTLSKEDITKHRVVAKTDFIWKAWFKEMVMKTVIKKGCKYHFDDVFESMNETEKDHINLDNLVPDEEDDTKFENEKKRILGVISKEVESYANLKVYFKTLPQEFAKDGDIIEAFKSQKLLCKNTK